MNFLTAPTYPLFFIFYSHISHYRVLVELVEFPVLHNRFLLLIYHICGSVYISTPSSNLSHLTPLCNHKFVLYIRDSTSVL